LIIGTVLATESVVAAHVIRHLHLDDVGTPVGKLSARCRPSPNLCEIYNAKALERCRGGDVRHRRSDMVSAGGLLLYGAPSVNSIGIAALLDFR
jgi:hypothetical protein